MDGLDAPLEVNTKIANALLGLANVTSANELPSREARPGRRVNNSAAAGKLQGGELRKDCVKGALERGLAGRERGVRGV